MERIEKTTLLEQGVRRMQERISDAFDRSKSVFDGAVIIDTEIDLSVTDTKRVKHKLGRKPRGTLLVHWDSDNLTETWTLRAADMAKESVELQVFNVSGTGIYQLRVLVF